MTTQPDEPIEASTEVLPPIFPTPSVLERAMGEAVDYWRGEACWWRNAAILGWSAFAGALVVTAAWAFLG